MLPGKKKKDSVVGLRREIEYLRDWQTKHMAKLEDLEAELSLVEAKLTKAVVCIVEAMIAPEAMMIAGKPVGMTNKTWEQMVRSVGHARATIKEIGEVK